MYAFKRVSSNIMEEKKRPPKLKQNNIDYLANISEAQTFTLSAPSVSIWKRRKKTSQGSVTDKLQFRDSNKHSQSVVPSLLACLLQTTTDLLVDVAAKVFFIKSQLHSSIKSFDLIQQTIVYKYKSSAIRSSSSSTYE